MRRKRAKRDDLTTREGTERLITLIELNNQKVLTQKQVCKTLGIGRETFIKLKQDYENGNIGVF